MAASDQNYRSQYTLDVVFAISSLLMLISIVWMFMQDFYREFKTEQRAFRDVESAVAQRLALAQIPAAEEFNEAEAAVTREQQKRKENLDKITKIKSEMATIQAKKERSEKSFQDIKAYLESKVSFYNIDVEEHGVEHAEKLYRKDISRFEEELAGAKAVRDDYVEQLKDFQRQLEQLEGPLTDALSAWKKINDKFETQAKLAIAKRWGFGDTLRDLPVLDAFASPIKIQQTTIEDVPIDYNFKRVTRFDRCTTCHLGIERPAYTKDMLRKLGDVSSDEDKKLNEARERLRLRIKALTGTTEARNIPDPESLTLTKLSKSELNEARVNEFCAHPRLELFVGANSKHPAEKFGCTSCHSGQGSGTSFTLASHTPNSSTLEKRWAKEHDWESIHMWDFPMLPMRFIESSCLKCHYQVTDLIASNNRNEAPQLLRGYNLIRENGCFGCHEIQGRKGGRQVGPDLRLEASPPLEELTALERARIEADVDNQPGNLRKVGPSLYRLAEKTSKEWTARWIRSPREFRPDTKMPHFYGLTNNDPNLLPDKQKSFPDAEIQSVAHYLFEASNAYLKKLEDRRNDSPEVKQKDETTLAELQGKAKLTDAEKIELANTQGRINLRKTTKLVDLAPGNKGNAEKGRQLFSERGCLACHSHNGTATAQGSSAAPTFAPAIVSDAQFGPNLSQLAAKLGKKPGDKESARIWLMQWIKDPHVHSPRSRMPVTHLDNEQVADIAAWLLSQSPQDLGSKWDETVVPAPGDETLKELARVYLVRLLPKRDMDKLLGGEALPQDQIKELPAEEQQLASNVNSGGLQTYLGRKAVGRLGCYACHDIPGFENAKPIGVGLNDWGKKPADRLAFEDIANFIKAKYFEVPSLVDDKGKPVGPKAEGNAKKLPYERFFADMLTGHLKTREGFLHQKLQEPRSYDYNRMLAWDDRARMPQFKFARIHKKEGESDEDYEARSFKEEADAREAVMTFVLGLVAEPVPTKSISQPSGDRLAEVKGRQVLDKYNCAGCHLIQPGVFDFRVSERGNNMLEALLGVAQTGNSFNNHINWEGKNPTTPDRLEASGVQAQVKDEGIDEVAEKVVMLRLTQALRFYSVKAKDMRDIPANNPLQVPAKDMIFPPPQVAESNETLQAFLADNGSYGGKFSDLLTNYLAKKDKQKYSIENDDSPKARVAGPPNLIGQGERTQPDWLYQFLLDPQPVRRLTVLRMPRFNLSPDEAKALTAYFAASARIRNPAADLVYPHEAIPQQEGPDGAYWKSKTPEYVARLKNTKDAAGKTLYLRRLDELKPIWQEVAARSKTELESAREKHKYFSTQATHAKDNLEKFKEKKSTDKDQPKREAELDAVYKDAASKELAWGGEVARLEKSLKDTTPERSQEVWEEKEAYLMDAFRLLTYKDTCRNCHQVGNLKVLGETEGPPLELSHKRLRPGWTQRWIGTPNRFLTYQSVMPPYFDVNKSEWQDLFPGTPRQQFTAARDILMALPSIEAIPATRYMALPLPDKTGDKK